MHKIQITEAKKIADRTGAEQVVVIAFGPDHFAVTSYGATKLLCAEAGKWIDMLVADLESGRVPTPSAARYARVRASGERSGAGGSPMPPRPVHERLDESTSGELARGTGSPRRSLENMAHFLIELCRHSDEYWGASRTLVADYHYRAARRLLQASGFKYVESDGALQSIQDYLAKVIQEAWHRGRFTAIDLQDGKAVAAAILEAELPTKPPSKLPA